MITATRHLVFASALSVFLTLWMRSPAATPVEAAVFPPEPTAPVAAPLTTPDPATGNVIAPASAAASAAPIAMATLPTPDQPVPVPTPSAASVSASVVAAAAEPEAVGQTPAPAVADSKSTPPAEPIEAIEAIGAEAPHTTGIRVMTTGYCPCQICCGPGAEGITSIHRDVHRHPRGIAVDPALIPYRTVLTVPGYGTAMADDTGAAMRHDGDAGVVHIDLRFRTHAQAKAWGVRWVDVDVPDSSLAAALTKPAMATAETSSYASGERN